MDSTISPAVQRFAAVGLAIAVVAFGLTNLVAPSWNRLFETVASLSDARFDHARVETLAARTAGVDPAAVDTRRRRMVRHLIDAPAQEGAQAALQARLQQLVGGPTLVIEALQPGPMRQVGPVTVVSTTIKGHASERAWLSTLAAIEQAGPTIIVERAEMTSTEAGNRPRRIAFELTVAGFWAANMAPAR